MSDIREQIRYLIDALETEAEKRMERYRQERDYFDWGFSEGITYAIERLKERLREEFVEVEPDHARHRSIEGAGIMGRSQRDKGSRSEREFARLIGGERVPLSGAAGGRFAGDVVGLGMTWEVKRRSDGFRELYKWLEGKDALAVRADRREWLVVMPLERFLQMVGVEEQDEDRVCEGAGG